MNKSIYKNRTPKEIENQIIDNYINKGLNSVKVGKLFNMSATCVQKILKRNGYKLRSKQIAMKKYFLNRDYFETIDDHDKASILGFCAADGCICYNNKGKVKGEPTLSLKFGVHPKDEQHLEFIKDKIKFTGKIFIRMANYGRNGKDKLPTCRMEINDSKLCRDLMNKGVGMQKSFNMDFPYKEQVPKEFLSSYIRGIFEGDGWITLSKIKLKTKPYYLAGTLGICVTERFGKNFKKFYNVI